MHDMSTESVASTLPPSTPLDLRLGLTDAAATAHPLRWGIVGTGRSRRSGSRPWRSAREPR